MSSSPIPAVLYRRPTLRLVTADEKSTVARPIARRRRTFRSARHQILSDPQYIRLQIL